MRVMSSFVAAAAIAAMSGGVCGSEFVMPAALPAGTMKTIRGRKCCVAQAKRASLKLRRQKAHRMHCRGRAS